jgi:putative tricarboxylic transport membrane protein
MEVFNNMLLGFTVALTPANLFWCFVGVFLGTIVGILPGLGTPATIAILLPLTFQMSPTTGLIMMAGIYYGSKYGGSTTSILMNLPGETASVVTCLDGYQMARAGRAGPALGIAAIASFVAGTVGILGLMFVAPPLANFALKFGPPEYFALMVLGLTMVTFLAGHSMLKGLIAALVGVWLAGVGTDTFTSDPRFTFGRMELLDGIDFIIVSIGIFAVGEVLVNMEQKLKRDLFHVPKELRNLLPSLRDIKACRFAFVNGSVIGFFIGIIPGAGASIASFLSYGIEKAVSRHPEKFGTGAVEGVAAPEGANNSETGGALVPLLTLGIPGSNSTAMLLAALTLWGMKPGPLLIPEHPEIFWGLVASMYIGNVFLVILNLPLIPLFAQLLRVPYYVLYPIILGISFIGVYVINNSIFDLWMLAFFGLLGYALRKLDFPAAPLILALVLGIRAEESFRQSLTMSQGSMSIFVNRELSLIMLLVAAALLLMPLFRGARRWKERAVSDED